MRLIGKSPSVSLISAGWLEGRENGADGIKKDTEGKLEKQEALKQHCSKSIHVILGMPCKRHHYCKLP